MLIFAGCFAPPAQDALAIISDKVESRAILPIFRHRTFISVFVLYAELLTQGLQFAFTTADARKAVFLREKALFSAGSEEKQKP